MSVNIERIESDVVAEGAAEAASGPAESWEEMERVRTLHEQARRDARRTAAEGYDD